MRRPRVRAHEASDRGAAERVAVALGPCRALGTSPGWEGPGLARERAISEMKDPGAKPGPGSV